MTAGPDIRWMSERTLRVGLADAISARATSRVVAAHKALAAAGIPALIDLTPAYTTVLLTFDPGSVDRDSAEILVRRALAEMADVEADAAARVVEIPVCYGGEAGPDLEDVATHTGLSRREVIGAHAAGEYTVCFLGFMPGFGYLSGLPARLHTPRLAQPRPRVPAGSVAIGGGQTGVYPRSSPGGWRLIGRTSLAMFDPARAEPCVLRIGDRVRFVASSGSPGA